MAETTKTYLGKYELLAVIGDGAEGRVYKASCTATDVPNVGLGELVAVKRLKNTGHDKESQQFLRQIKILSKLNHPHIVRHKDSFVWREKELEEDIYCLVMELLDGEPLKAVLEQHRSGLAWERAGGLLAKTLQALQYASQNGVIHRDLKPSNIFITTAGHPKLVDFGIARHNDGDATATSSAAGAKGTFDYMAPDFALQPGGFRGDEQSDIFSFGVILYFTLAGSLPFPPLGEHADRGYYIRWLGAQPPSAEYRQPVFRVLSHARTCISKCIAVDRAARFKTFDEVMASFAQIGYRKLKHGREVYEFTDWLGKGGFGEVFRARRVSDQRPVAIKRLFSSGQSARFVREAKILRAAAHPNLTEYIDFVEVRQRDDHREFYLVLEYLEGMPGAGLRERIKNSAAGLDPVETLQLFGCYLACLEHLHAQGIIHRDLKPGNLYAPENHPERAKIFDLGIAHDEEGTQTHGQVPGTLDFMPPEFATQTSGRGSPQSDIYSLGVTLYQTLTKKLPFPRLPEKEAEAWIAFFRRAENPLPPAFDHPVFQAHPELVPLLRRALDPLPRKRFPNAAAMRDGINQMLQKWGITGFDYDDEQPTAVTTANKPATSFDLEEIEDIIVDTKVAADAAEFQKKEQLRLATESAELKKRAEAERIAAEEHQAEATRVKALAEAERLEQERQAAEAAAKQKQAEAERLAQEKERQAAEEVRRQARAEAERKERERQAAEAAAKRKQAEAERLAQEKERQAAEEIRRQARAEAERVEKERQRIADAEAAEIKRVEDERRAIARAERAQQRRKTLVKIAKAGGVLAVIAGLVISGLFGWNKAKIQLRENAFSTAVRQANTHFRAGEFKAAIDDAEKALAIHRGYPAMQDLITEAKSQIQLHESYDGAMKNGQSAFESHDYSNCVTWAAAALQKLPTDSAATKLQEKAQKYLDNYHAAANQANAAYLKNNFAAASAEADQALGIYPNDAAMQQIKANAQTQIANQQAYLDAMNNAQAAFEKHDFTNVILTTYEALRKYPSDDKATQLRTRAQKILDNYHDAVNAANAAWQKSEFTTAMDKADQALAVYTNNTAMQQLKAKAQTQIENQKAYTKAITGARAALAGGDYTNALAGAMAALQQLPADASASQLRDSAQKQLILYHDAVNAANAAWQKSDFAAVVADADQALAVYPNNTAMQQLKASAQAQIANQQAYAKAISNARVALDNHDYKTAVAWATTALDKIHGDAQATKIRDSAQQSLTIFTDTVNQAQAAYQKKDFAAALALADKALAIRKDDAPMLNIKKEILRQLDRTLAYLLESFGVTVPAEIKYAELKEADRFGAIGDNNKPIYLAQVDKLEKLYQAGNWLNEGNRQTSIRDLRKAIDLW